MFGVRISMEIVGKSLIVKLVIVKLNPMDGECLKSRNNVWQGCDHLVPLSHWFGNKLCGEVLLFILCSAVSSPLEIMMP